VRHVGPRHDDDSPRPRLDELAYTIHEAGDARVAVRILTAHLLRAEAREHGDDPDRACGEQMAQEDGLELQRVLALVNVSTSSGMVAARAP
jgi:hypothetical protein